jgi:hypothetical protein
VDAAAVDIAPRFRVNVAGRNVCTPPDPEYHCGG